MTIFKGHLTGFKPGESNECTPNFMGPPATKFGGRPAVPDGPLQRYPGEVANISNSNRRASKARHGAGDVGSGTKFNGFNAFTGDKDFSKTATPKGTRGPGRNMNMGKGAAKRT